MSKKRSSETMFPIVQQYLSRHCSQEAFITKHQIHKAVLQYWVTKYRKSLQKPESTSFIEIQVDETGSKNRFIHIQCPNGLTMDIPIQ